MIFLVLILPLFLTLVTSQSISSCTNQNTCNECIQTKGCSWCLKLTFGFEDSPRCLSTDSMNGSCEKNFIENPINEHNIIMRKPLTQRWPTKGQEIVQIYPQRMSLKLRINQPQKIALTYSGPLDFPVDVYYLMDLSFFMNDHKDKLSKLGKSIADAMPNITNDFRIGFGSFDPNGFTNHMELSTDASSFEREVRNAPISENHDTTEVGLDALMQVIVCSGEIGWRARARRFLIFATDAGFHNAVELEGVINPNDGKCHIKNHTYTHSPTQDYPTVAHINEKVREYAVNVIFAVTESQEGVYKKLSEQIVGSYSSILQEESIGTVELIRDGYNRISSTIELRDNASETVDVKYYSSCFGGRLESTNKCGGLKVGDKVEFEIEITATSCSTDHHQTLKIYPVGIDEALVIDLELICSCACESPGSEFYEYDSYKCNGNGIYKCGVCECAEGFYGRKCECSMKHFNSDVTSGISCRPDNYTEPCFGRGNCVCDVCQCHQRTIPEEVIYGNYCECDNFSCERHNGLICSGPDQGTCQCGHCVCAPGWGGLACSCRTSTDTCRAPEDTFLLCSGNGECVCGECECFITEEGRYTGRFCEKCPTCS